MRIVHLIDSLEVGGAEKMVAALAGGQAARGDRVRVCCLLREGALADGIRRDGVEVYPCRRNPLAWPGAKLASVLELRGEFRRWGAEILHCHNITATLYGAPAGRLAGARGVFATRHGFLVTPELFRKERLFWLAARLCDRVVAVSEAGRNSMAALPYAAAERISVVRNGVSPPPAPPPARDGEFTLLMVARLARPKDHETLLRAVALLRGRAPAPRLLLAGGGPLEGELRATAGALGIEGRVEFLGDRQDVGDLLARSDVFVLSSRSEGLPISMLEAMAAGLPMILSDVGGIREVAGRLPGARLVPPGDAEAMASAILEFHSRRAELRVLGAFGRREFERQYTVERMVEDYAKLYSEALQRG